MLTGRRRSATGGSTTGRRNCCGSAGYAGCASAATAAIITRVCSTGDPCVISNSPNRSEFSTTSLPRSNRRCMNRR